MSPDDLLELLKTKSNARKAKSLEILHAVCREQNERGSQDFSIATIGRLCEERQGPATQSIRNKTGEDYRALIGVWASYSGGHTKRPPKPSDNPLYEILEKIPDPAVRAVMGAVIAQNHKLLGELNLLKRNANVVVDMRKLHATPFEPSDDVGQVISHLLTLTNTERAALENAVSIRFLEDNGWASDEGGRILNDKGRVLFKTGFMTAIQKILKAT